MKNIDPSKLDANTREQLKKIKQDNMINELYMLVSDLDKRVGVLEEVRTAQKRINVKVLEALEKLEKLQIGLSRSEGQTLWERIKDIISRR